MNADFEANEFAWILEDCLKRLRSGQGPEDCLAAYPDQAEGLRPLLSLAGHIRSVTAPQPRPQAIQAGRERMLAAARSNSAGNSFVQPVSSGAFSRYTVRIFTFLRTLLFGKETYGMKFALRLAIDLVVILMIGSVLSVNASARSLPGDPLYGVKRTWEEVRLSLTLNDPARQQLQDQIRQLRLEEVREMLQMGRTGVVEFEGWLESIAANEWGVSGIRVRMLPDTIVEGAPAVGQMVRVRARVQNDGALTAVQVRVQTQTQSPGMYPPPVSTHTPEPPRPTWTAMPTFVPSRTPWPTHEPAHTWEPTNQPAYGPTQMPWPTYGSTQQPWQNDDHMNNDNHQNNRDHQNDGDHQNNDNHQNDDDHNNDGDHQNNDDHQNDGDHWNDGDYNNSGGSSWSGGGSGSHHSWP